MAMALMAVASSPSRGRGRGARGARGGRRGNGRGGNVRNHAPFQRRSASPPQLPPAPTTHQLTRMEVAESRQHLQHQYRPFRFMKGDLVCRFDGACRGNPGPGACGAVLYECVESQQSPRAAEQDKSSHRKPMIRLVQWMEAGEFVDKKATTNNQMEYHALLLGMQLCLHHMAIHHQSSGSLPSSPGHVVFQGDSFLLIQQVKQKFQVRSPELVPLHAQVMDLAHELHRQFETTVVFEYIRRDKNVVADLVANQAMDVQKPISRATPDTLRSVLLPIYPNFSVLQHAVRPPSFHDPQSSMGQPTNATTSTTRELHLGQPENKSKKQSTKKQQQAQERKNASFAKKWLAQVVDLFAFVNDRPLDDLESHRGANFGEKVALVRQHLHLMCRTLQESSMQLEHPAEDIVVNMLPPKYPDALWQAIQDVRSRGKAAAASASMKTLFTTGKDTGNALEEDGPMQIRYMLMQLVVYDGEYLLREAQFAARNKQWDECAQMACNAYDQINQQLIRLDSWYALCLAQGNDPDRLAGALAAATLDASSAGVFGSQEHENTEQSRGLLASQHQVLEHHGHDLDQINTLMDRIVLSRNHTEEVKNSILRLGEKRMRLLTEKLSPMWQDRDTVKRRVGMDRWTNNPNPKQDFAERRKLMEEELQILRVAMEKITMLMFLGKCEELR